MVVETYRDALYGRLKESMPQHVIQGIVSATIIIANNTLEIRGANLLSLTGYQNRRDATQAIILVLGPFTLEPSFIDLPRHLFYLEPGPSLRTVE